MSLARWNEINLWPSNYCRAGVSGFWDNNLYRMVDANNRGYSVSNQKIVTVLPATRATRLGVADNPVTHDLVSVSQDGLIIKTTWYCRGDAYFKGYTADQLNCHVRVNP